MLTGMFALTLMDSGIAEALHSPFIVPVAGCAMIGSIVVAGIWSGVRTKEIQSHERLARIAQGLPVEPEWDAEMLRKATTAGAPAPKPYGRPSDGAGAHRAGMMLCSIGAGLMVFFIFLSIVLRDRDVMSGAAAGILPLAIGIGFFIDAKHRKQEYDRWMQTVRPRDSEFGASGFGGPVTDAPASAAPPPPMTPAQASDWRPLH